MWKKIALPVVIRPNSKCACNVSPFIKYYNIIIRLAATPPQCFEKKTINIILWWCVQWKHVVKCKYMFMLLSLYYCVSYGLLFITNMRITRNIWIGKKNPNTTSSLYAVYWYKEKKNPKTKPCALYWPHTHVNPTIVSRRVKREGSPAAFIVIKARGKKNGRRCP